MVLNACKRYNAIGISAIDSKTVLPLIDAIKSQIWNKE
jgi:GTP-binding protein HflX